MMGSDDDEDGGEMIVVVITAAVSGLYVLIHLVSRIPLWTK